jgi:carbonic anhydrase/acetyltransferase-like protein (isoleucine patch superfamily)
VNVGARCVIGAGSVVTRSIPDGHVAAGNPARVICTIDDYARRIAAESLDLPERWKTIELWRSALERTVPHPQAAVHNRTSRFNGTTSGYAPPR